MKKEKEMKSIANKNILTGKKAAFLALALATCGSQSALAADGEMKVTNHTGGKLNVVITHAGCSGIHDGILTACSVLPEKHKGYADNIANKREHTFIFRKMGMSTGYGVVGIDTTSNQRYTCSAGINSSVTFYHNSAGKLTCKL